MVTNGFPEQSDILLAFQGKSRRVPVWFMRQAGRYLPQYQALKAKRPLSELFRDPPTAAEITLQPVGLIGVDAAILFADILTMPSGMGFGIEFINGKGPVISNPITSPQDLKRLGKFSGLGYVTRTIQLVNHQLPSTIPLIGFAGSPFTVATYLCSKHQRMMYASPLAFHQLMELLTVNTIAYLRQQQEAGIKLFQLFDTWAGSLRHEDYKIFVLPYVQRIFKAIKLPSIYYLKNCAHLMDLMEKSGADMLSVCETVTLGSVRTRKGLQGNFLNSLLYAEDKIIIQETRRLLKIAKSQQRKYIFNLSHGVMPDVDPEKLKLIVRQVHQFPWAI